MKKIPPFRLVPQPLNEAAANIKKFEWAAPDIGTRHQLGGDPEWIEAVNAQSVEIAKKR